MQMWHRASEILNKEIWAKREREKPNNKKDKEKNDEGKKKQQQIIKLSINKSNVIKW